MHTTDAEFQRRWKLWRNWRCRQCGKDSRRIFKVANSLNAYMVYLLPPNKRLSRMRCLVKGTPYSPPQISTMQRGFYCCGCFLFLGPEPIELFQTLAGLLRSPSMFPPTVPSPTTF